MNLPLLLETEICIRFVLVVTLYCLVICQWTELHQSAHGALPWNFFLFFQLYWTRRNSYFIGLNGKQQCVCQQYLMT